MVRLLENFSLELIKQHDISVPSYSVVSKPEDAVGVCQELGGECVLKALVPTGKRGKAGAVRIINSLDKVEENASAVMDSKVGFFPVNQLIVMEKLDIVREFFVSITFDSNSNSPIVLLSKNGGVDIEELSENNPEVITQIPLNILKEYSMEDIFPNIICSGFEDKIANQIAICVLKLFSMFKKCDCRMIEINPLVELKNGKISAASAVITLDDQALFRQKKLKKFLPNDEGNGWRPLTDLESKMKKIDEIDLDVASIRFGELEGDIGFMLTGGGYSLTGFSQIISNGGRPASTFDITPGINKVYQEKVSLAVELLLTKPGLKGLVIAGNVSNFTKVDVKMESVVRALKNSRLDFKKFPVVIRFAGPGIERAREIVSELPDIHFYEKDFSLDDLSQKIVELVYKRKVVSK
tara:strand:- start:48 stop:1277 length:1230 start_codon:yes stop_codon:yes gene_type:complete